MSGFALQARRRTVFVLASLVILFLAMVVRLLDLQVFRHRVFAEEAQSRLWTRLPLQARRGRINDSTGRPLALNKKANVLWVDANHLNASDAGKVLLAQLCDQQGEGVIAKVLGGELEGFFYWAESVEPPYLERLEEMIAEGEIQGVILEAEPKRTYPYGPLFGPVLGYMQEHDNPDARKATVYTATVGVEGYYDRELRGDDGWIEMEQDKQLYMIPIGYREEHPPADGAFLTLTLDLNVQFWAEQLLIEAIDDADAKRGDIVVMDPRSGAIMAMVSYPSFDPNRVPECAADERCREVLYTNPVIGQHYEPGSTFKIVTMAIALEERVVRPDSSFECSGHIAVGGWSFHNWNGMGHGPETMPQILLHSCNVGAVWLSQRVGPDAFYRHVEHLGFGRPTGVDIAGEASGMVRNPEIEGWSASDLAANAFGQAINVTPLQLVNSVAAVANGGYLMQPYIVQSIGRNGVITQTIPTIRAPVLHEDVCRDVTDMLVEIGAHKGPDGGPLIPGYQVALKTGTAQIPLEGGGGYDPHRTIASAIGYAPAEDPQFLILVRIEGKSVIWGAEVAVPVFADMAKFMLTYLRLPPADGTTLSNP
jgi:cell division protein FtsI (penicillin-binding protein 3)